MTRGLALLLVAAGLTLANSAQVEHARKLFARAQYREVVSLLSPSAQSGGAPVNELIGKSYFIMGEYKKAAEAFERAVAAQPASSALHHWLGKAYGRRAETANVLLAPGLASKA